MTSTRSILIVLIAAVQLVLLPASSIAWGSDCGEGGDGCTCCSVLDLASSCGGCCASESSDSDDDADKATGQDCACLPLPAPPPVHDGGGTPPAETVSQWDRIVRCHSLRVVDRPDTNGAMLRVDSGPPDRVGPSRPMIQVFRL